MSEVDDQIARARATMERVVADYRGNAPDSDRARAARVRDMGRRLTRAAIVEVALLVAVVAIGIAHPIGLFGLLAAVLVMAVVGLALIVRAPERPVQAERLPDADVRTLPAQAGRWLRQQRAALPTPAVPIADRIGARLDALAPQLAQVDTSAPEVGELRQLVGEQLPAFLADYGRVPAALRGQARNGRTPDAELVDGLQLIDREIAALSERLARTDIDSLATRGRYMQIKYEGE